METFGLGEKLTLVKGVVLECFLMFKAVVISIVNDGNNIKIIKNNSPLKK